MQWNSNPLNEDTSVYSTQTSWNEETSVYNGTSLFQYTPLLRTPVYVLNSSLCININRTSPPEIWGHSSNQDTLIYPQCVQE